MSGKVYLVGAGPGSEELLTLKAYRLIRNAEVIIYDRLVGDEILTYANEQAEMIYVGKKAGFHAKTQQEINEIIVNKAKENKVVVRLKGGDPFVFGRGGEEVLRLIEEGIPYEVVPGISSSLAVPSYAGIPVTHRNLSTSFHVITGHEDPTKQEEGVDYSVLAKLNGTLIFLMGLNQIHRITSELIKYGKSKDTPAAVLSKGTTVDEKIVIGTLQDIEEKAEGLASPAIIVVGSVVELSDVIRWRNKLPLYGKKILITREEKAGEELVHKINELGGKAYHVPTIAVTPRPIKELEKMYDNVASYQWILFSSVPAVELFFDGLLQYKKDVRALVNAKLAAMGKSTKEAIEKHGYQVDYMPKEYIAESLVKGLAEVITKEDSILIPRSSRGRNTLPEGIEKLGASVDIVPLYDIQIPPYDKEKLHKIIKQVDMLTFTSGSTVDHFVEMIDQEFLEMAHSKKVISIGPVTTKTAEKYGFTVEKTAYPHTSEGLLKTIVEVYEHVSDSSGQKIESQ